MLLYLMNATVVLTPDHSGTKRRWEYADCLVTHLGSLPAYFAADTATVFGEIFGHNRFSVQGEFWS